MPSQATNPLFNNKTLKSAAQSFSFPSNLEEQQQNIIQWIEPLEKGVLDEIKEVSLHGQFLADVFQQVLGYRSVIQGSGQAWEIHAEQTISDGGGSADGALGFFTATEGKKGKAKLHGRVIAPIELKGAKNDLDRPAPGRNESAVNQGWRYANYTQDCKWVIVSNYREIRLYQTSKTPAYCESFRLADLRDLETFKRFYFLLCRKNFLPSLDEPKARSRVDLLLAESNEAEDAITKDLYQQYKNVRINLTRYFRASAPENIPNRDAVLIEKAQKLLDRVLFIAFCEDRRLLPEKTIRKAHDHKDQYNPRSIWDNYKAVFRWVDVGNDDPPIPGYNGGLFKHDPLLDGQLQVTDLLCTQLKELARFDFDTEVSVNILGHIFEQSVTDLEELRALAAGQAFDQKKGKRKTQGVYYTPAFVTHYIVDVALGGYLKRQEQALTEQLQLEQIPKQATRQRRDAEIQFWEAYRDILLKTRVIDPACGSGAFLIAAFDYLNREYERVNEALAALAFASQTKGKDSGEFVGQRSLFDLNKTLLNENLYGVDLSPESVEITKLSLWLKTAEQGKALTYLDDNIKVGNSIVADSSLDPRGFNWEAEFSQVFADGGFDVVIGNPPYVRQELLSPIKPYLQQHYESYDGVADLYTYFYEKGLKILKPDGVLSYIVTNKWFKAGYGEPLRRFFAQNSVFEQILDFGHAPIFADADVFPCIVSVRTLVGQASSLQNPSNQSVGQASSLQNPSNQSVAQASSLPPDFIAGAKSRQDACPTEIELQDSDMGSRQDSDMGSRQDACPTEVIISKNTGLRITRRRLPHWEMDGAIYFVTFNTWEKLELNEAARKIVLDSCQFFDNQRYVIFAIAVMPDHVHWLIQPLPKPTGEFWSLSEIMHSIKSYSAKQIPKVMKHIGTVWQIEWFDRIVRDEAEFHNTWEYIRQNPVQASLSDTPETYPFLWQISDRPHQSAVPPVAQASSLPLNAIAGGESRQDACPTVRVCPVPREKLSGINLPQYVQQEGYDIPWSRFTADAWSLEPPAVDELMQKIKAVGVALKDFVGVKPRYGIKTGLNEAFLVDDDTRNRLIKADPNCAEIIKPYLRGQDIKRWNPDWQNLWIILLKSSGDFNWGWNDTGDRAEEVFSQQFPSIYNHLKSFEQRLRKREDQGRYWWELRSCAYYSSFENPKIIHTDITWRPQFAFIEQPLYLLNTAYMWVTADLYALAVVNSPLLWAYMWRNATHGKDEALRLIYSFVETIPIVQPTDSLRVEVEMKVTRLIEITKANQEASREVLDWLQVEHNIDKLGQKLEDFASLDCDQFVQEVKTRKPKGSGLSPKALKELREVYSDYAPHIQTRRAEALTLEMRLSDLVNQAYGLTPEEIDLMWKTAPPRMPIPKPTRPA